MAPLDSPLRGAADGLSGVPAARVPRNVDHKRASGRPHSPVGTALRAERERQQIGLREMARRLHVSPSLISQIELGRVTPSVGTLYAIANELSLSLDQLLFQDDQVAGLAPASPAAERVSGIGSSHPPAAPVEPVVRSGARAAIELGSGVRWERLTAGSDDAVDFLHVVYDVGGASTAENALVRHAGREYGYVLSGRLGVTVEFDTYELGPGDAIAFDSTLPHRLFNAGDEPVNGIWFVLGRRGDVRFGRSGGPAS